MSLQARVAEALGEDVLSSQHLAGGDLGGATRLDLADGRRLVAKTGATVEREGKMLRAIAATGAAAPHVHHCEGDLLVMHWIEADGRAGWSSLAEALSSLHAPQDEPYGWPENYALGSVKVENARSSDWPQFWAERRILCHAPHLPADLAKRLETLAARLPDLLPAKPPAALLHGDLWRGNILFHQGRLAALIDPASHYGDREVDLAMTLVFNYPPAGFFEACAPNPGWRDRVPVYQLWPLLLHLRLFGSAYRSRTESLLAACGA